MREVFIDEEFKCHVTNDGSMRAVETTFFDGKCDAFVEGYILIPAGETRTRSDGVVFRGEMIAPWKDYFELDAVQREYERQQMADMENALAILLGGETI